MTFLAFVFLIPALFIADTDCEDACQLVAQKVRGAITVDGVLDEADWKTAPIATGFIQFEPEEGSPATQPTEVRVLLGTSALYVSAVLHDSDPESVLTTLGRRDEFNRADWFVVSIDSYFDRKTAYNFAVSAAGVQADGIYSGSDFRGGGGGFGFDTSWDAIWDSAVRLTHEGWIVEMRIPYSMLRFSDSDNQRWGINFRRVIPRLSEVNEWVMVPRTERSSGRVAQFGTLEGITGIKPRRNLQIRPYSVSNVRTEEGAEPGTIAYDRIFDVGGDVKVGLSSNFTIDATVNPDFGQVEADPAELNLTAYETFFRERRPFFTEGVQIFRYAVDRGGELLYTRRIGADAPIIGAAKLSGRSNNGLSYGFFGATTGDNFTPGRFYSVGRLQHQLGEISSVGGMVTLFDRSAGDHLRSMTGGMDWDLRFNGNRYKFDGQLSATHRAFPGSGIDPEQGFALSSGFDRQRSVWNFSTNLTIISDRYNPNDLGRLRRNNYTNLSGGFSHQINGGNSFGPFQRGTIRLFGGNGMSFREGLDNGFGLFLFTDWVTSGFHEIDFSARSDYLFGGYDVIETRGLGPRAKPRELSIDFSITTDTRREWMLQPGIDIEIFGNGGRALELAVEGEWSVSSRINVSVDVGAERENNVIEWAANEAFAHTGDYWEIAETSNQTPGDVESWRPIGGSSSIGAALEHRVAYDDVGHRYVPVFGARDTRSVDFSLRSDLTLSPTLSVQFYGQLFAAKGAYEDFLLLQDRDTHVPVDAYPKQYDFSFTSFQTNTVLRWEYRPGSRLFVVWTQSRRGDNRLDAFDLLGRSPYLKDSGDQFLDAFDVFPTNVFLVKLSYTFLR